MEPHGLEPHGLGPYTFRRELAAGQTYLCDGPDGRPVVLKRLADDCLHRGGLHPAIRDRLARTREVPHPAVSQLRGVDRLPAGTFAVWDHVAGLSWEEATVTPATALAAVRAVEALHAAGLVHGAIHGRNLLLTPAGDVRLLHPSPYLYTDPAADLAGLLAACRETAAVAPLLGPTRPDRRPPPNWPTGWPGRTTRASSLRPPCGGPRSSPSSSSLPPPWWVGSPSTGTSAAVRRPAPRGWQGIVEPSRPDRNGHARAAARVEYPRGPLPCKKPQFEGSLRGPMASPTAGEQCRPADGQDGRGRRLRHGGRDRRDLAGRGGDDAAPVVEKRNGGPSPTGRGNLLRECREADGSQRRIVGGSPAQTTGRQDAGRDGRSLKVKRIVDQGVVRPVDLAVVVEVAVVPAGQLAAVGTGCNRRRSGCSPIPSTLPSRLASPK